MTKTKIVATVGPASASEQMLATLLNEGVNVFRLNFSHGTLAEHEVVLERLNRLRQEHWQSIAVMGDLSGPKIRVGLIEPEGEVLEPADEVMIVKGLERGNAHRFGITYDKLIDDMQVGERIFLDDGGRLLEVVGKERDSLRCRVLVGGALYSHKGVNLPDTEVSAPAITEYDWRCVQWAMEHGLDYLAMSFVRRADDIRELQTYLDKAGSHIKVVAKIEKPQAVAALEEVVGASDAVLVARGDLGVEMDLAEVPLVQKRITDLCRRLGKPVIVATQMLQSMIESPTPTRAEANDVANAILDFADAVMLSGETAVGAYPVRSVQTMRHIAEVTERYMDQVEMVRPRIDISRELVLTAAIARSVAQIIDEVGAKLAAVWSQSGSAARLLSKARVDVPVLALSSDETTCRQMALDYGILPYHHPVPEDAADFAELVEALVVKLGLADVGDQIVLIAGRPVGAVGTTNTLLVHTVSQNG